MQEEYVEICGGVQPTAAPGMGTEDDFDEEKTLVCCGGLPYPEPCDREGKESVTSSRRADNSITELVFILDKSGSMSGMEADTIGGFNSMLAEQKKGSGEVLVTTVLFSSRMEILHDRLPIAKVEPLTEQDYRVGGSTALYDAIGKTVKHIETVRRYIRRADTPSRTLFVITTDGEENASRSYTRAEVKKTVKAQEEAGWEFLFLAANIDAFSAAEEIGIKRGNAASYSVAEETDLMYSVVSDAITCYRSRGCFEDSWASDLGD